MKTFLKILCLFNYVFAASYFVHHNLISGFTSRESIKTLIMFHCGSFESITSLYGYSGSFLSIYLPSIAFYSNHPQLMTTGHHRFGLIADLSCPSIKDLLQFCSDRSYFNESYRWLLVDGGDPNDTLSYLESLNLNVDTHLTLAARNLDQVESSYELFEVYGTIRRREGKNHVVKASFVNFGIGTSGIGANNFSKRRICLDGLTLRAVVTTPQRKNFRKRTLIEDYLLNLDPPKTVSSDRLGYQISVLLSEFLNFRIQLIIADDWQFNEIGTNSSKGVIGQLQNNLVDFSISPLPLRTESAAAFDTIIPITATRVMIVFRHPKNSFTRNIFLLPFRNSVWASVSIIMIVACTFLLVDLYIKTRTNFSDTCEILLTVLGFLGRQPMTSGIDLASARIVIIASIFFCFIVHQFYSTFIISYLLISPPKSIQTVEDLLTSNLKCGIEDFAFNLEFFNKTKDAIALKLYKDKILTNKHGFTDINTGIELVKRGGYAFLMDCSYGYPLVFESFNENQICDLQEISLLPLQPLYLSVPQGSPLKEIFRVMLRRAMETGSTDRYNRIFNSRKPRCTMKDATFDQVQLLDIVSLYRFLALGGALGVGILLVEVIEFRIRTYLEMESFLQKYPVWID